MDDSKAALTASEAVIVRIHHHSRWLYGGIAVLVFVFDQWTKTLVERSIPLDTIVPVIPHFFNLTHTHNSGAAFGIFSASSSPWKTIFLVGISVVLLVIVVAVVWRSQRLPWEAGVALGLILGGAASNLLDRIRYGQVTDFLDFYVRDYHWFTFNLADSAIVAGAVLLAIHLMTSD